MVLHQHEQSEPGLVRELWEGTPLKARNLASG